MSCLEPLLPSPAPFWWWYTVVVSAVLVVTVNVDHMTRMAVPVVLMVVAVRVVVEVGDGGCDDGSGELAVTVGWL